MAKTATQTTATKPKKPAAAKPKATKPKAAPRSTKSKAAASGTADAKARFSRAIDEARAGIQALTAEGRTKAKSLGKDAQGRAGTYRKQLNESSNDLLSEAKAIHSQAKDRAADLAQEGKNRATDALSGFGKVVDDSAGMIDEKLGAKYGDYARTAAKTLNNTAAHLDSKDVGELAEDALDYVRKSPGLAIGLAALGGFIVARILRGSDD